MENQSIVNPNLPPVQPPPLTNGKNKSLIILAAVVVGIILIIGSYFLGQKKVVEQVMTTPSSPSPSPTIELVQTTKPPDPSPTKGVFIDVEYSTYTNQSVGLSIEYPKATISDRARCNSNNKLATDLVPLQIVEDLSNKTIYLSFATEGIVLHDQTTPGVFEGSRGCNDKIVDLDYIKNGYADGYPRKRFPVYYAFKYKKITSDADLLSLAEEAYPTGTNNCTIEKEDTGTDTVTIKIVQNPAVKEICLNRVSNIKFLYSNKNHLAVTWFGGQYPYWQANGKAYDVKVNFL